MPWPSLKTSRTRWPGAFGAIMETSTSAGGVIVPKRMLKPWANISVLPGFRPGAIVSLYSLAWPVSGVRIMIMSASAAASFGVFTASPSAWAFARERLPAGQADDHVDAAVLQVERVGVALAAVADHGDLAALQQAEVGVGVVVDACHRLRVSLSQCVAAAAAACA